MTALLRRCVDRPASREQLIATIESDPGLLATFLELARAEESWALDRWDTQLETPTIRLAALFCGQQAALTERDERAEQTFLRWWRASLATACLNEVLAERLRYGNVREAYLTALLLRIGGYLLLDGFGERYLDLLSTGPVDLSELVNLEFSRLGIDQVTLGASLVERWRIAAPVQDALRYHHLENDRLLDADLLIRMSAVAATLTSAAVTPGDTPVDGAAYERAAALLNLGGDAVDTIVADARGRLAAIEAKLGRAPAEVAGEGVARGRDPDQPLRRETDLLALTAAIHDALGEIDQLAHWWDTVGQLVQFLFGLRNCVLFELDASGERIVASELSPAAARVSIRFARERSMVAECFTDGEPLRRDSEELAAVVDRELAAMVAGRAVACIPISCDGEVAAVIVGGVPAGSTSVPLEGVFGDLTGQRYQAIKSRSSEAKDAADNLIDVARVRERASEIAQEIHNPLAIVQNYFKVLTAKLPDDQQVQHNLSVIEAEIQRIGSIVREIQELDFAAAESGNPGDLNRAVRDIADQMQESSPRIQIDLELGTVRGWSGEENDRVKQILLNLLKNAVEAIGDTGRVHVRTRSNVEIDGRRHIELTVADEGPGIPRSIQGMLFQTVATSKGADHQGIGLATVRRLVEEIGGSVSWRSRPGEGTEFRVLIPQRDNDR